MLCVKGSEVFRSAFAFQRAQSCSFCWACFLGVIKIASVPHCLQMTGSNEFKLNQTPDDGISSVKFSPNTSQFLLVSSWDTTVRLYDVPANTMRLKYQHSGAVLDCAFYVSVAGGV